jgi:hypothetical protein
VRGGFDMSFEIYKPRGEKQKEKAPAISLSKTSIVLNKVAREKLGTSRIELAYDMENNIIRIKAAENGGIKIKKTKFFGKGFFNQFGISKKGKFAAVFDEGERALFVKL